MLNGIAALLGVYAVSVPGGVRAVQKVVQDSCHLFVALGQQELLEVWLVEEPAQIHLIRLHVGKAIKLYLHYFENIQSIRLGA